MKRKDTKNFIVILIIAGLILSAAIFRMRSYQDALSIGTPDTTTYIQSAKNSLFSWEILTAERPFTMSLVYKLLEPPAGYSLTHICQPWIGTLPNRVLQPGLDRISIFQAFLSILGWSLLTFVVARWIKNYYLKVASALIILTFAYSPQLADWDGVLMSESISFSLFAILLALSIELAHRYCYEGKKLKPISWLITGVWTLIFILWLFVRDVNAYLLLIFVGYIIFSIIFPQFRKNINLLPLLLSILILLGAFFVQNMAFRSSNRWVNSLNNLILKNVIPYDDHLAFFENKGMPVTSELIALKDSMGNELGFFDLPEYMRWVRESGYAIYTEFLITHPGWAFSKFFDNLHIMFQGNRQPYFRGTIDSTPLWMIPVGDFLHVRSKDIILVDLVMTSIIIIMAIRFGNPIGFTWAWIWSWLFISEIALLFISFHGDPLGVERHTLLAVMPLRLSLWLLPLISFDLWFHEKIKSI